MIDLKLILLLIYMLILWIGTESIGRFHHHSASIWASLHVVATSWLHVGWRCCHRWSWQLWANTGRKILWAECKSMKNVEGMPRVWMELQTSTKRFCTQQVYIFWHIKSSSSLTYNSKQPWPLVVWSDDQFSITNGLHLNQVTREKDTSKILELLVWSL